MRRVDPGQCGVDVWPQRGECRDVAGALEVGAGQHHEQRRGIDAAVIAAERHLAQLGHLAAAHLVQDLAGFGLVLRVERGRLLLREEAQHAAGHGRVECEAQQGGDQRVAAEHRAEPGDAGVGIGAGRLLGDEHAQIVGRAVHRLREILVRRRDLGGAAGAGAQPPTGLHVGGEERLLRAALDAGLGAGDLDEDGRLGARLELQLEHRAVAGEGLRRRLERQPGGALDVVEATVRQRDPIAGQGRRQQLAAALAAHAAHLEQVAEIRLEAQLEPHPAPGEGEVAHRQPRVAGAVGQEQRALHVDHALVEVGAAEVERGGVGAVGGQHDVVGAQGRRQQQRRHATDRQVQPRQIAGVLVVQPVRAARHRQDVAAMVEHAERVAVLQRAVPPLLQRNDGGNRERLGGLVGRFDDGVGEHVHSGLNRLGAS